MKLVQSKPYSAMDISAFVRPVIILYLFESLSLTDIDEYLINTRKYNGWFSKVVLNHYGIDTEGFNRGLFSSREITEVVLELKSYNDLIYMNIAKILEE